MWASSELKNCLLFDVVLFPVNVKVSKFYLQFHDVNIFPSFLETVQKPRYLHSNSFFINSKQMRLRSSTEFFHDQILH